MLITPILTSLTRPLKSPKSSRWVISRRRIGDISTHETPSRTKSGLLGLDFV